MLNNNYLSVIQFQLKLTIHYDNFHDFLVVNEDYNKQMEKCIEIMRSKKADIVVFPEMSYQSKYDDTFKELSKNGKLIVFGSTYFESTNYTIVFYNGKLIKIVKRFCCGSEPMVRFSKKISVEDFISKFLKEKEFYVKGNKVYILNCLEYYQAAYAIARNFDLCENLFGFIVPCSNSNPKVFMDESRAIHNHNEFVYSFVCNRIKEENLKYGQSYIYGPIQPHEKEWLSLEGIKCDADHNSSILKFDSSTPSYCYGEFASGSSISRFGRSDLYINTPLNVTVKNLF